MLRVVSVPYLVARPLTEGLDRDPRVTLIHAEPSRLARGLADGSLDVALASAVLAAAPPHLPMWMDGPLIASRGPIRSVLLFTRPELRSPRQVRTWIADPASRTGRALAGLLLRDLWQADAQVANPPPEDSNLFDAAEAAHADAVQMIGDAALQACADVPEWRAHDLGAAWLELTGLPFAFAGWIGRAGFDFAAAAPALDAAAARGAARLDALIAEAGPRHPLGPDFVRRYLAEDLVWRLPRATLEASLAEFARRLAA
jgi:chorismate dehydratase